MATPYLSIIVPALGESRIVNRLLNHAAALTTPGGLEVILSDGSPRGTTLAAVSPGVRDRLNLKTTLAPRGRAVQMNRGAALADGDILLFLHADTLIAQAAVDGMRRGMDLNPAAVGGAFDLAIDSSKKHYRLIEFMANRRSRFTGLPYGDQAIFLRKPYFFQIGGFSQIPLMEDVELMRRIKRRRDKILILPMRVLTSARRWETEGPVRCTLRNWLLISLYLLGVSPYDLAKFYRF